MAFFVIFVFFMFFIIAKDNEELYNSDKKLEKRIAELEKQLLSKKEKQQLNG